MGSVLHFAFFYLAYFEVLRAFPMCHLPFAGHMEQDTEEDENGILAGRSKGRKYGLILHLFLGVLEIH